MPTTRLDSIQRTPSGVIVAPKKRKCCDYPCYTWSASTLNRFLADDLMKSGHYVICQFAYLTPDPAHATEFSAFVMGKRLKADDPVKVSKVVAVPLQPVLPSVSTTDDVYTAFTKPQPEDNWGEFTLVDPYTKKEKVVNVERPCFGGVKLHLHEESVNALIKTASQGVCDDLEKNLLTVPQKVVAVVDQKAASDASKAHLLEDKLYQGCKDLVKAADELPVNIAKFAEHQCAVLADLIPDCHPFVAQAVGRTFWGARVSEAFANDSKLLVCAIAMTRASFYLQAAKPGETAMFIMTGKSTKELSEHDKKWAVQIPKLPNCGGIMDFFNPSADANCYDGAAVTETMGLFVGRETLQDVRLLTTANFWARQLVVDGYALFLKENFPEEFPETYEPEHEFAEEFAGELQTLEEIGWNTWFAVHFTVTGHYVTCMRPNIPVDDLENALIVAKVIKKEASLLDVLDAMMPKPTATAAVSAAAAILEEAAAELRETVEVLDKAVADLDQPAVDPAPLLSDPAVAAVIEEAIAECQ